MKYNKIGEQIKYDLNFIELNQVMISEYKAKKISFEKTWKHRPCCSIDKDGNIIELADCEKTIQLRTEGELNSMNISCYLIDDIKILNEKFHIDFNCHPEDILIIFEFDSDMNILVDFYCHTAYYGGIFDFISSHSIT